MKGKIRKTIMRIIMPNPYINILDKSFEKITESPRMKIGLSKPLQRQFLS